MRTSNRIVLAILLVLVPLLAATPASAGGPTSVLLVWPGTGHTESLYIDDPNYAELSNLVGAEGAGVGKRDTASHEQGPSLTVTWLIHDVEVWRVDRIYLTAEGGPWIASQVAFDGSNVFDAPVHWHTSADGDQLVQLLDRIGMSQPAAAGGGDPVEDPAVGPRPEGEAASAPIADHSPGASGWWWALAGALVGALLTATAGRLRPAGRVQPRARRQPLIDA